MTHGGASHAALDDWVNRVLDAHGGLERWRQTAAVGLRLSSGGLAFAAKGQPRALHDVTATVATLGHDVVLRGSSPRPWHVRFSEAGGNPLVEHLALLRRGRRRLAWSVADVAAFAGTALWTYVHVPFVLADPDVQVEAMGPWREAGETWQRLAVTFAEGTPTHCRRQSLYVDGAGLVRRHDYTALAFGRWARAAQYLSEYRTFAGLSLATRRRVYPRLPGGRRAPAPRLVWIDVHGVELEPVGPMRRARTGR